MKNDTPGQHPQSVLRSLITGHWISQAVRVAAEFGIADLLEDGARTSEDLAQRCGADARSMFRLMRALSSVGVFVQGAGNSFALAPVGDYLRSSVPDSLRAYAQVFAGEPHRQAWADLAHSVRTGQTGYEHRFNIGFYDELARDAGAQDLFDQAMAGSMARLCSSVVEAYDFAMTSTLVDVGGGDATMLVAILTANPGLQGVLFDRASLMTRAKKHIADSGLAGRCKTVAGDFFRSLPVGADAYLLVRCLRAFDDQRAAHILLAARRAIRPDGRLLIVERILLPDGENIDAALGDLNMLVLTGGSERSAGEFERLLDRAGFQLARIVRTRSAMSILEAIPNRRSPTFRVSDTLAKEEYMQ